jgi:hypothetical protein
MNLRTIIGVHTATGRIILPALGCLAGIFAVTCFLRYDACVLGAKRDSQRTVIRFDSLDAGGGKPGIVVQGPEATGLRMYVHGREYAVSMWGELRLPFDRLPRTDEAVRFVAFKDDGTIVGVKDTLFRWSPGYFPLHVDFACSMGPASGIWVAGNATPGERIEVKALNGRDLGSDYAGDGGVFNMASGAIPGVSLDTVLVLSSSSLQPQRFPIRCPVLSVFPFSRSVTFDLAPYDSLTKYGPAIDSMRRRDYTMSGIGRYPQALSKLTISMEMPAGYSGVDALQRAWLGPEDFLSQTVGDFRQVFYDPGQGDALSFKTQSREKKRAPCIRIARSGASVHVTIEKKFLLFERRIGVSGDGGEKLPAMFVSQKDTMIVKLNGHRVEKFMGRLPDSSSGACIAWYGGARDSAEKGALAVLDVGSFLVDVGNNQSDNGTSADTSELYLNGFLRQYDEKTLGSPAESVMKLVTWIVIFAAFLHFTRLRRIKDQNDAGQAGALSLVFLTWGIWYFGQQCLPPQFWEWIHSVLRGLFRGPSSGFGGSYSSGEFLLKSGSAPLDAYAYACAMLFAFLPFYFHKAEAAFLENPGDVINKKGIWTIVRLLWLLIVFAGVIALGSTDAPRFSQPWSRASLGLAAHAFSHGAAPSADMILQMVKYLFPLAALPLAAAAFGWEALLFAVGQSVTVAYAANLTTDGVPVFFISFAQWLQRLPWWCVGGFAVACAAAPLRRIFVRLCAKDSARSRRTWTIAAIAAAFFTSAVEFVPQSFAIHLAAFAVTMGLAWLIAHILKNELSRAGAAYNGALNTFALVVVIIAGLYMSGPIPAPGTRLSFYNFLDFSALISDALLYCAGLAVVFHLMAQSGAKNALIHDKNVVLEGTFLFAALLTGLTTWMGVPIPFLLALVVPFFWLLRPRAEMDAIDEELKEHGADLDKVIGDTLHCLIQTSRYDAIISNLRKKFEKAEMTAADFEKKRKECSRYLLKTDDPLAIPEKRKHRELLALGTGSIRENVLCALRAGFLLSSIPIGISLVNELPAYRVSYPFPIATFALFVVLATVRYLLYAFMFGFFFTHIRGRSGLIKGIIFAGAIIIPFAGYQLVALRDPLELRAFIIWAAQIFLFCSVLGLWIGDVRLLKKNGYGIKDVVYVHNVPMLSAYSSAVAAAIGSAIITVLSGSVQDLSKFFINIVVH